MRKLLRLEDHSAETLYEIFRIADEIPSGKYDGILRGKTAVLFFPNSSIRTRITFEKGVALLGGQSILFPPETLDKKEALCDVAGYLNNWADLAVVRHKNIAVLDALAKHAAFPLVNAMTDVNHPCEILSDLYALSKIRKHPMDDKFLFVGTNGNIGRTWKEAADIFGFSLEQCCPAGHEIEGVKVHCDIREAIRGKDIVCTDSLPSAALESFKPMQITRAIMEKAKPGAILNPCPPFFRGEEVSADVIDSDFFVGYVFKKCLLEVQQAIMIWCMTK